MQNSTLYNITYSYVIMLISGGLFNLPYENTLILILTELVARSKGHTIKKYTKNISDDYLNFFSKFDDPIKLCFLNFLFSQEKSNKCQDMKKFVTELTGGITKFMTGLPQGKSGLKLDENVLRSVQARFSKVDLNLVMTNVLPYLNREDINNMRLVRKDFTYSTYNYLEHACLTNYHLSKMTEKSHNFIAAQMKVHGRKIKVNLKEANFDLGCTYMKNMMQYVHTFDLRYITTKSVHINEDIHTLNCTGANIELIWIKGTINTVNCTSAHIGELNVSSNIHSVILKRGRVKKLNLKNVHELNITEGTIGEIQVGNIYSLAAKDGRIEDDIISSVKSLKKYLGKSINSIKELNLGLEVNDIENFPLKNLISLTLYLDADENSYFKNTTIFSHIPKVQLNNVKDLSGLKQVENLVLDDPDVKNMQKLHGHKIKTLSINDGSVEDIGGLQNIVNLKLDFVEGLKNFSSVDISNMHTLELINVKIKNLDFLQDSNISVLKLVHTDVTNFKFVETMQNLREFTMCSATWCKTKVNGPALGKCSKLEKLYLTGCNVFENLEGIGKSPSLKQIMFEGIKDKADLSFCGKIKTLETLIVIGATLTGKTTEDIKVTGLKSLMNVKTLTITDAVNLNLSELDKSTALHTLIVVRCDIVSVTKCASLREVALISNNISNVKDIANLNNSIHTLNLAKMKIDNIAFLSKYKNLQRLNLFYTNVVDVTPLAKLDKLTYLDLGSTYVKSVSGLKQNFDCIGLYNCAVDASMLNAKKISSHPHSDAPPVIKCKPPKNSYVVTKEYRKRSENDMKLWKMVYFVRSGF